jgi:hypothetical protein
LPIILGTILHVLFEKLSFTPGSLFHPIPIIFHLTFSTLSDSFLQTLTASPTSGKLHRNHPPLDIMSGKEKKSFLGCCLIPASNATAYRFHEHTSPSARRRRRRK